MRSMQLENNALFRKQIVNVEITFSHNAKPSLRNTLWFIMNGTQFGLLHSLILFPFLVIVSQPPCRTEDDPEARWKHCVSPVAPDVPHEGFEEGS